MTLTRTAFLRKPPDVDRLTVKARKSGKERKPMKGSRPKMTPIRKSARNQECTLNLRGVCNHDPETTVLCHSNFLVDGKGMGLKAPDTAAAYGCSACHDVLDGRAPRPAGLTKLGLEGVFYTAMLRTHAILRGMGLL